MRIEGSEASEILNGLYYYNEIYGYAGDDTINGGEWNDTLEGGLGNDLLDGGLNTNSKYSDFNIASYRTAASAVVVQMQAEDTSKGSATGGAGNDLLINIQGIIGSEYDDTLMANWVKGGLGDDTVMANWVEGGLGDDKLYGLTPHLAVVSYGDAVEGVVVNLQTGTATGGAGNDTLNGFISVSDSQYDDSLIGDDNDNKLTGSTGNDTLNGGGGADLLSDSNGNNLLDGGLDNDALIGGSGNDTLLGGNGNDTFYGSYGNDVINGGEGDDTLSNYQVVNLLNGTALQQKSNKSNDFQGTWITIASIENIEGTGSNDVFIGNTSTNVFTQGAGGKDSDYDYIQDYGGGTTIASGAGNDTILIISSDLDSTYDLGNNIIDAGSGNDNITLETSDLIPGNVSTITGGAGVDTYFLKGLAALVITDFTVGVGGDIINASYLASLTGHSNLTDLISLGYLQLVDYSGSALLQWDKDGSTATNNNWQNLALLQNVPVTSITLDNFIIRDNQVPTIPASFGAPLASIEGNQQVTIRFIDLNQHAQHFDIDGAVSRYSIKTISSGSLKIGTDESTALPWDATTNNIIDAVHNAYWTPATNTSGTLDAFTVTVDNSGPISMDPVPAKIIVKPVLKMPEVITYNDTIFNDNFAMATGTLLGTGNLDKIKYGISGGFDNGDGTVSYISSFGELILTEATGNYRFVPNDAGIEALENKASVSFTVTAAADDVSSDSETLTINIVARKGITESNKNDTLNGGSANNSFDALAGDDIIKGFSGADTLVGGLGADKLSGGKGADSFKFNSPDETGITDNTRDVIVDFNHWQKDKIDLSTMDANTTVNGDNAFTAPVVGNHFAGTFTSPASLFFEQSTHILYANVDEDVNADFSILLTGVNRLVAADFVL